MTIFGSMAQGLVDLAQRFITTAVKNMAAANQIVKLAVNVTVLWKSGIMCLPSLTGMAKEIMKNWKIKILIPAWGLSVLPSLCRM